MNNKLRELREDKGWSQQELGDRLKVSRQTIISIEKDSTIQAFRSRSRSRECSQLESKTYSCPTDVDPTAFPQFYPIELNCIADSEPNVHETYAGNESLLAEIPKSFGTKMEAQDEKARVHLAKMKIGFQNGIDQKEMSTTSADTSLENMADSRLVAQSRRNERL